MRTSFLVGLLLAASGPLAQPAPPLEGHTVEGELEATSDTLDSGEHIVFHDMVVTDSRSLAVVLTSDDFDPYLILLSPSWQTTKNDDWDRSTSESRILVHRPEVGTWSVGVSTSRPGERGAYRLSRRPLGPAEADRAEALARAEAMAQQARAHHERGDPEAAASAMRASLAIREEVLGPTHPDVVVALDNLARLLELQGDDDGARPLYERALAIREATLGPDDPVVAIGYLNLAHVLETAGDYREARPLYERALALGEATLGPDHPVVARAINGLAALLVEQGEFADARSLLERDVSSREAALGPGHPDVATALNNLAVLLQDQGDAEAARPLLERAVDLLTAARGPDHPDVATALNNLGHGLERQGDYAAARPLYERALAIREGALGPDHPDVAGSLNNLGMLRLKQGNAEAARPLLERAVATMTAALGPGHPDVATTVTNLARSLVSQGDPGGARPLYERALAVREAALGPDHIEVGNALINLATVLQALDDDGAARPLYGRAARIYDGHAERVLPALSPTEQRAFVELGAAGMTDLLLSSYREGPALADAYGLFGGWKGLLLRGLRRQTAVAALASTPEHAPAVARLEALRARVARAHRDGDSTLADLLAEKEALERRLASSLPPEAAADPWRQHGGADLADALPEGGALADVYRYVAWERGAPGPERYAVVVTTHGASPRVVDLGPTVSLDAAVAAWRGAVMAGESAEAETAELAATLWGPLADALPDGTDRVWIAPAGTLVRIPWAVFARAHPAARGLLAAQVPSARALLGLLADPDQDRRARPGDDEVLLVGDVDFGPGDAPWRHLEGTRVEVDALEALAAGRDLDPTVLDGAAATATAVRRALPNATFAHLATHGFFDRAPAPARDVRGTSPRGAALGGSARGRYRTDEEAPLDGPQAGTAVGRSPLARSGLAFAGANAPDQAQGGGTLTAEELLGLDLSRTRLVTLSACDTGRGAEVSGQGVLGLQASLAAAGTRAVLMSLWPVDDAATAALMEAFYRGLWEDDLAPAAALRRAQDEVASTSGWQRPVYWAGWTLSGAAF